MRPPYLAHFEFSFSDTQSPYWNTAPSASQNKIQTALKYGGRHV
jgi:hypothetical protein